MTGKTEIDITWLARWFRVLWWFPYRYLFFFFAIPGFFIAANFLPALFANSPADPDYSTILRSTDIAILSGSLVFPILGLLGVMMIGRMNNLGLAVGIPLIIGATTPFIISLANGHMIEYYMAIFQDSWKLLFDAELFLPILAPIMLIVSLYLLTIRYGSKERGWHPFRQEHFFLSGFRSASAARLKLFGLTALSVFFCAVLFNVLRNGGDIALTKILLPNLHPASNQFVWYSSVDPKTANGYFYMVFNSKNASTLFFANLVLFAVAATIAVVVFRYSLRYIRRFNTKFWKNDPRPPVLLLRSFSDDSATVWPTALFRQITRQRYRLEEAITGELSRLGPVIGIGQPGESLPKLGAYREELDDDHWQARILELMDHSQLIVLIAGTTKWVQWELNQALARGHQNKLMIVFPNVDPADKEARLKTIAREYQDTGGITGNAPDQLAPLLLMHSLPDNSLVYISSHKAKQSDYQFASRIAAIQKNSSGVTLGSTLNQNLDAKGVRLSKLARRSLISLAWILVLANLSVALLRPSMTQFTEPTCEMLAGAPWDPNSSGNIWIHQLKPQKAIPACQQALAQDPKNPRHLFHLGRAMQVAGKTNQAQKYYENAAKGGYAAAMNNHGLALLHDKTLNEETRHKLALRWFAKAIDEKLPDAVLSRSYVYAASPLLDPTGSRTAANFLLAVSAGVYKARAQIIGGMRPFGFGDREILALERILNEFGLFDEKPDKIFTFETLQSAAIFFSPEVQFDLHKECLTVRKNTRCYAGGVSSDMTPDH